MATNRSRYYGKLVVNRPVWRCSCAYPEAFHRQFFSRFEQAGVFPARRRQGDDPVRRYFRYVYKPALPAMSQH